MRFESTLKQFEQRCSGGIYPAITQEQLQKILIPLPPKETQIQIVTLMDYAYRFYKEKEAETKQLLKFINSYVLEQLNIQHLEVKQEKIFIVNIEDMKGKRYDAEYYQLKFEFLSQLKNPIRIKEFIVDYQNGINISSNKYLSEGLPFVRVSDINEANLKQTNKKISESLFEELKEKFSPKKGEGLYTKDGPIGLNYIVTKEENYIISGSILRLICKNIEYAKFLKIILSLKLYKELVNKESNGTVIKHLNLKKFLNILIPFPEKDKRDKIVNKIDKIESKV